MQMRARKAVGCFVLLAYLGLYSAFAATFGAWLIPQIPHWAELVFFVIAGIAWVFPLKPLFGWMSRGG